MIRKVLAILVAFSVQGHAAGLITRPVGVPYVAPASAGGGGGGPDGADTFDRANATTITGSGEGGDTWSNGDNFSITSNKVDPEISDEYWASYSTTLSDNDYCVEVYVEGGTGRTTISLFARDTGSSRYHLRVSNGTIELYKGGSLVDSDTVSQPTASTAMRLCVSGSGPVTLNAYYDGNSTPIASYTDSASVLNGSGWGIGCYYCDNASDVLGNDFAVYDTVAAP